MDKIFCISTIILAVFYQLIPVNSLSFTLSSGTTKCLKEELHKDVLVTGEYQLSEASQKTHLTVWHMLYIKEIKSSPICLI
jgi:hypothetical protein